MKNYILFCAMLVATSIAGWSQSSSIVADQITHSGLVGSTDLSGYTTYRLFAQIEDGSDFLTGVIGWDTQPMSVTTSTSFYQSEFGSNFGDQINSIFYDFMPELEFDSYVTIGYSNSEQVGIPFAEDPSGAVSVDGLSGQVISVEDNGAPWLAPFAAGGDIIIETLIGGAWFVLPEGTAGIGVGVNNSVLIGQFTTDGTFDYCLNYTLIENLGTDDQNGVEYSGGCAVLIGCGDDQACNYNADVEEIDNSLCSYIGDSCDDSNDSTLDDILNENCFCEGSLAGCMDNSAINYNENAVIDDGSCQFGETCDSAIMMEIDGSIEVGSNVGALDENDADEISDCWGSDGSDGDVWYTFVGNGGFVDIQTLVLDTQIALYDECGGTPVACDDDSGDAFASLIEGYCTLEGTQYYLEIEGWNGSEGDFLVFITSTTEAPDGAGCSDPLSCNYDENWSCGDQFCMFTGDSCDDGNNLTEGDALTDSCECLGNMSGCTNPEAVNYDPNATIDDGSCFISSCEEEPESFTYCPTNNDNSIWVFTESVPGEGVSIHFASGWIENNFDFITVTEGTGVDFNVLASNIDGDLTGLTFSTALPILIVDLYTDGSVSCTSGNQNPIVLEYFCASVDLSGCTEPDACNYSEDASTDDGSCQFEGGPCDDGDWNTSNDVLQDDCSCAGDMIGCTNEDACNYSPLATADDGSCIMIGDSCDDGNSETTNDTIQGNCGCLGSDGGCTDESASNYDSEAIEDDGSCCYGDYMSIVLYDSFGDGGAMYVLSDNLENSISEGQLLNGSGPELNDICLDEGCYIFELNEDAWPDEISADLFINGELVFQHNEGDSFNQYPIVLNVGNDPECIIYGCLDSTACNYSGLATEDDGSCDYEICVGCSSVGATNYSDLVTQDDGSCSWDVSGVVFIDDNFNGVLDPFEQTLPYQNVVIEPGGIQVITDNNGAFMVDSFEEGTYFVSVGYTGTWTNYTTPTDYEINFPLDGGIPVYFGVTNEDVPSPSACVDFYQWGFGVPCNDVLGYNICYRNMSPYTISGVVEVVLDDLLSYNSDEQGDAEVDGQTITWTFDDLSSWEMSFDDLVVNTPDETHIGEFMTSTVTIYAWHEGELIPITTQTISQEVTCAYDPNDITGIPFGYTDDHLVLPDTRMEYVIRFQNTGNAPAGTVMVVDTLDTDMDPSTFQLIANSHSVMTTILPSGRVEFLFENINLPDSIADEPGSHGLVSFKIDFIEDVAIGEEVNSTAHIFFDNNPAVVTNTTWHTIHECGGESEFSLSNSTICAGETVEFASTNALVEAYQWNIDSTPASTVDQFEQQFSEPGEYIVQFIGENPLCEESSMQMLTVYDLPDAEITEDGAVLTANEGASYQWFMNGEAIYGATEQTFEIVEDGSYSVEVTNENSCSTTSESVMMVNVSEVTTSSILLYPNPMTTQSVLEFSNSNTKTIQLTDLQGRVIKAWDRVTDQRIELQRESLASGKYFITITEGDIQRTVLLLVR